MQKILILGAGKSSSALIEYLSSSGLQHGWLISVADFNINLAKNKSKDKSNCTAVQLDIHNDAERRKIIDAHDLILSMLPSSMHVLPAKDCVDLKKHFLNASYVTEALIPIFKQGQSQGLIFMGELGLDPGLDHISAMCMFNHVFREGGIIESFRSFAGGLVALESDDNPWHYKFSWNPKNVILAGRGTAQFKANGRSYFVPYPRLFRDAYNIDIPKIGTFDWYPNRDSMLYIPRYDLQECPTVIRGTLRYPGFCRGWNALIELGLTDPQSKLSRLDEISYEDLIRGIVHAAKDEDLILKLAKYLNIAPNDPIIYQLIHAGILSTEYIPFAKATPAEILENLLTKKWALKAGDKDRIVMHHEIVYRKKNKLFQLNSSLELIGQDHENTAMARLVGLPLAIMAELVMSKKVLRTTNLIPIETKVYQPIINRLGELGIKFLEEERILS
jgi:saccharopine dehydrogenase (NADP+, L-glutamate forming)